MLRKWCSNLKPLSDALLCIFHLLSAYGSFFFLLGPQNRCPHPLMGGCPFMGDCRYSFFLKKWPELQTGVHLLEVATYGRCPLVGVRLYMTLEHCGACSRTKVSLGIPDITQFSCTGIYLYCIKFNWPRAPAKFLFSVQLGMLHVHVPFQHFILVKCNFLLPYPTCTLTQAVP